MAFRMTGGGIAANCGMHLRSRLLNGTPITSRFCRNCHLTNRANEICGTPVAQKKFRATGNPWSCLRDFAAIVTWQIAQTGSWDDCRPKEGAGIPWFCLCDFTSIRWATIAVKKKITPRLGRHWKQRGSQACPTFCRNSESGAGSRRFSPRSGTLWYEGSLKMSFFSDRIKRFCPHRLQWEWLKTLDLNVLFMGFFFF